MDLSTMAALAGGWFDPLMTSVALQAAVAALSGAALITTVAIFCLLGLGQTASQPLLTKPVVGWLAGVTGGALAALVATLGLHPELWPLVWPAVAAYGVGFVIYRVRGGWLGRYIPGGTTPARLIWVIPTGLLVWWCIPGSDPRIVIGAVALCDYAGLMIPHGRLMDMGRYNGTTSDDAWGLACVGIVRLELIALPGIAVAGVVPAEVLGALMLAGCLHTFSYWLNWRLPWPKAWHEDDRRPIDGETAWAECLWGGCQLASLVMILPRYALLPVL